MRTPWRRGRGGQPTEYQRLVQRSLTALDVRRTAQAGLLHLDEAEWSVDQDAGLISFTRPGGEAATAPVQIVGSLDPVERTWLWGWDHPSVRPPLREHARRVRVWGEDHGVTELTTRLVPADDDDAWRFAALACELGGAQGVWRCATAQTVLLVTFGTVTLAAAPAPGPSPAGRDNLDWADDLQRLPSVRAPEVVDVVRDWMTQIHHIERRYRDHRAAAGDDEAANEAVDRAIADKQPVYERFWRREDEYHRPCSVGTIRWYDVESMTGWQVYRLGEDAWRVAYHEPMTGPLTLARAYDVRRFSDGLRIVDHLD